MSIFSQIVSNWLEGVYKVRTTKLSDTLIQHVRLTNDSGVYVDASGGGGGGGGTGSLAGDGRKVVASAGTAEALATTTTATRVIVTAENDNTDFVVVGASTVVATLATRRGIPLAPGQTVEINADDLANVYIDAVVTGEGVTYVYEA